MKVLALRARTFIQISSLLVAVGLESPAEKKNGPADKKNRALQTKKTVLQTKKNRALQTKKTEALQTKKTSSFFLSAVVFFVWAPPVLLYKHMQDKLYESYYPT